MEMAAATGRRDPPPRWAVLCLFLCTTLILLGTLTSAYAYDGVAYSGFVLLALLGRDWQNLFQANHLLHGPLAYIFALWTGGAAGELPVHLRLQILNALLGGATVALLFRVVCKVAEPLAAASVSLALAFSYAFWHFSTDVEAYTLAALLLVLALGLAIQALESTRLRPVALAGAGAGLAALGQIAHGVFGLVSLVVLSCRARRSNWLRTGVVFATPAAAVMAAAFLPLLFGPLALFGAGKRVDFLLGYARPGAVATHLKPPGSRLAVNLAHAAFAVMARPPLALSLGIAAGVVALILLAAWGWRQGSKLQKQALVLALGWWSAHLAVFLLWDPNFKYWIAAMVPFAIVGGLALQQSTRRLHRFWRPVLFVVPPAALLWWNLPIILEETRPERNRFLQIAQQLRASTPPDGVVLISGRPPYQELKVYLPYFANRRTVILEFLLSSPDRQQLLDRLEADLSSGNRRFFVLSELIATPEVVRRLETDYRLPAGRLEAMLRSQLRRPVRRLSGDLVLYRLQSRPGSRAQ